MNTRERMNSIDGLKGFSCLVIMIYHYMDAYIVVNEFPGFHPIRFAFCFVEVFMAISGFMMAYNYKDRIKDMNFIPYFAKRYFKLMPLYWLTSIFAYIFAILGYYKGFRPDFSRNTLQVILEFSGFYYGWFGITSVQTNMVLWVISVLLLCYILYFVICKLSKKSNNIYILLVAFIFVASESGLFPFLERDQIRIIASFMFGALLYELYLRISQFGGKLISLCMAVIVVLTSIYIGIAQTGSLDAFGFNFYLMVILILCPLTIYGAIYVRPVKWLFETKVFQYIGKISMSVYMWHLIASDYFWKLDNRFTSNIYFILVKTILMIVIASVSCFLVEPMWNKMLGALGSKMKKQS